MFLKDAVGTRAGERIVNWILPVVTVVAATAIRMALDPLIGLKVPYALFFLAIAVTALFAGLWSGIAATLLSFLLGLWFFAEPVGSLLVKSPEDLLAGIIFLVVGLAISALGYKVQKARRVAQAFSERQGAIFDKAGVGIIEVGANYQFIDVNERACAVLGYSRQQLLKMNVLELTWHEDQEPSDRLNRELFEGKRDVIDYEKRYKRSDGSPIWVHVIVRPIRDREGRWHGAIATMEDISKRKAAEAQLNLQAAALEASPNAISLSKTDPTGTIVWVNPAFTKLTGYTAEETIGKSHKILRSGQQDELFYQSMWETIARGDVWRGELVNRRKDGTLYYEEMGITPVRDDKGHISHYLAIKQDITVRKRAELALRESEERFRLLANSAPLMIWQCKTDLNCDYFNESWLKFTGRPLEEELDWGWAEGVHAEDKERCLATFSSAAKRHLPFEMEYRLRHHSGDHRWILDRGSPRLGADGTFLGFIGACVDIHDRKQSEESLRRQSALLDLSPDAIIVRSPDGVIKYWSKGAETLYGWAKEEALGRRTDELLRSKFPEPFENIAILMKQGRGWNGELIQRTRDGREVRVLSFWRPNTTNSELEILESNVDITDRKRVEAALQKSEERFRALLTATSDAVYSISPDWSETHELKGRDFIAEAHYPSRAWIKRYVYPEDQVRVAEAIHEAMHTKSMLQLEHRVQRADGSLGWAFSRAIPLFGRGGEITEWFGATSDVTRQKEAEVSLARQRRLYEGILNNTPDLAYIFDLNHRFIYANEGLLKMWGKTWNQAIGKNCLELGYEKWHAELHDREIEQVVATRQPIRGTVPFSGTFGRRIYDYIFVPVFSEDGRVEAVAGTTRDITEHEGAKSALQESEARYRQTIESLPQLVWTCTPDGLCDYLSPQWVSYTGIPADSQLGRGWLSQVHPDDRAAIEEEWKEAQERGTPLRLEFRIRSHKGEYCWFQTTGAPLRDQQGRIIRWFGTNTDISEIKRLEERLRAALVSAERERAVADQANSAKDQFLAVLSHELRTPLTPVLAGVTLLKRQNVLPSEALKHLDLIERNVAVEARLIDDLLDLTRIVRGKISLERRQVDVCEVLNQVSEVCRSDIEAKRVRFEIKIDNSPLLVHGDPSRLQQVFWNLVKNAIKFTADGGWAKIHAFSENGLVLTTVMDNGIGVEAGALPRIFDAFEQGGKTVTKQFGGLGLGLAISKKLVEMHGGRISAHSEGKGRGAIFQVALPLLKEARALAEIETEQVHSHQAARSILLVEDHDDTAQMIQALLQGLGHHVEIARDVAEALRRTAKKRFDLLISDLGLPDRSGLDLMRELRDSGNALKGIALSGYGRDEDILRSKDAGFIEHLTKPVDFDVLEKVVERVAAL